MAYSISLAGKGGTGKTTIAAMIIKYLVEKKRTPILAVDADSNSNLNEVLGVGLRQTLGEAREDMKRGMYPGMTKDIYMEMKLHESVVETPDFDLIAMGRPEGPGCYCAANTLLKNYLDRLVDNYKYVVIDNEAGMEHISRLTTVTTDVLIVVSDPTRRGIQAASRIMDLTDNLGLNIINRILVINQRKNGHLELIKNDINRYKLNLMATVPDDPFVRDFDLEGRPAMELGKESRALMAVYKLCESIL
ncbi:MAG: AAA family ATPase [Deltaproteobacteria bacterium]|nr:AAA family ATPase [Deltaproteobacteria bacterium]